GGILNIYFKSGSEKVYFSEEDALKTTIDSAVLNASDTHEVKVTFEGNDFTFEGERLFVYVDGEVTADYSIGDFDSAKQTVVLTFQEEYDLTKKYEVSYVFDESWTDRAAVQTFQYMASDAFNEKYYYDGEDLGVTFDSETAPTKTSFKLWAPTSTAVSLNVYQYGDDETVDLDPEVYEMTLGEKGVWSVTVDADLDGKYYTYTVSNVLGTNEVVDPYARSAGLNGRRGMIVNFSRLNSDIGEAWSSDARPEWSGNPVDASIYELHVRDMTINPNSHVQYPGTFLGLAEEGTTHTSEGVTVSTGLDHIAELGVSHVQIQPMYDYKSVDESEVKTEMDDENYNWGYDPQNYNALEGSYSTDPTDGERRIIEAKQMIMAMHDKGLNVNMDVVYNHTFDNATSNFNLIVPNYYYRLDKKGAFVNGSGCGNEVASDHEMVRKFIIESVCFWAEEYHLSGFRFDLMGCEDNKTMIDVWHALKAIDPKIMVYGEPWCGGTSTLVTGTNADALESQQTVQNSLGQAYFCGDGVLVGAFNDQMRDGIKGSVWMDEGEWPEGWIQGNPNKGYMAIKAGIQGIFSSMNVKKPEPSQVIQYVSCHDNNTLHDQLIQTNSQDRVLEDMVTQAQTMVFTSQGVPFFQEGDEFMRSKAYIDPLTEETVYEHNSYKSGDSVNNMDYDLKIANLAVNEQFIDIIEARKQVAGLRLENREAVKERVKNINVYSSKTNPDGDVSFDVLGVEGEENDVKVIHSLGEKSYELDEGATYSVIYSNQPLAEMENISGTIALNPNQSVILRKN
nr:type I pullulanase [Bacilli bacterium]